MFPVMVLVLLLPFWTTSHAAAQVVQTPVAGEQVVQPVQLVQPIVSMRDRAAEGPATTQHKKSYEFTVTGADWVDTGLTLAAGEQASFTATGTETLPDGRVSGPAGVERGWKDLLRQFPLNQTKTAALVGRVSELGASVPFAIGAASTVTMPTSGKLYLRANLSEDLQAQGSYKVTLHFPESTKAASLEANAKVLAVSRMVTPETFSEIPRRVQDEAGNPGDMVNYALIGSETQVKAAFAAAGWVAVDKTVGDAVLHGLISTLSHDAYVEMPMSTLTLFGRPQDLSFARGDPLKVAAERHHLRVWKTTQTLNGEPMWVGSATHDIGFERDERNGRATHKIDPDIDLERQFLLQSFDAAGVFQSAAYVVPNNALKEGVTATGGSFHSDGRVLVMQLK